MRTRIHRSTSAALLAGVAVVVAACSVAGTTGSPGLAPSAAASESAAGSLVPSASTASFYLRAWTERAAEPKSTFTWPAEVTIANGMFYDGHVAVPAIYPGPLLVTPYARTISPHGIETIIAEARSQGLLASKTDFTDRTPGGSGEGATSGSGGASTGAAGPASSGSGRSGAGGFTGSGVTVIEPATPAVPAPPDSEAWPAAPAATPPAVTEGQTGNVGHLTIVVGGVRHDLVGAANSLQRCRCIADPGTAGAFAAFWQRLESLDGWLGADLGPAKPMTVERLAVLTVAPEQPAAPIEAGEAAWPLRAALATFGTSTGATGDRCGVVTGPDLARLLPLVEKSNSLTRFADSTGAKRSLVVRVLTPDEPSPCGG